MDFMCPVISLLLTALRKISLQAKSSLFFCVYRMSRSRQLKNGKFGLIVYFCSNWVWDRVSETQKC